MPRGPGFAPAAHGTLLMTCVGSLFPGHPQGAAQSASSVTFPSPCHSQMLAVFRGLWVTHQFADLLSLATCFSMQGLWLMAYGCSWASPGLDRKAQQTSDDNQKGTQGLCSWRPSTG